MNVEAAELIDNLIDNAIETLRRKPGMPQLTLEQWDELFASAREDWMRWLPDYLDQLVEEINNGGDE
jgi:hypothetical protein